MSYRVTLSELAHKKINYWVQKCPKEVSGFGMVEYDKEKKHFYITDAFLIKQTVGAAHTDIDPAALGKLMFQTKDMAGDLRFWWHSHVDMDVFWSGTDKSTILSLGKEGWIVASVFNKREEIRTAVSYVAHSALNDNVPETVMADEVDTYIETVAMDEAFKKELDAQFTLCVEEEKFKPFGNHSNYHSSQNWGCPPHGNFERNVDAVATRNVIDATRGESEPLSELELNEVCWVGLRGYGYKVEAEALGLKPKNYKRILRQNNYTQLANLEDRLLESESDGTLDKILLSLSDYDKKDILKALPKGKHQ